MGLKKNFKTPSGFNDFLPPLEVWRLKLLEIVREKFELFGFLPLDTPAIENENLLTGGDENFKKEIFRIKRGEKELTNKEKLALRFDLTVPLAKVVSNYFSELKFPFKRYQIGKVWRGEKAQSGRYREFLQCDADIVGQTGELADAEIVSLVYEIMLALGFENFLIKINNRKILNAFPKYIGFSSQKLEDVLRVLDKIDKVGEEKVKGMLKEIIGDSGKVNKLFDLFNIKAKDNYELIANIKEKILNDDSIKGFEELNRLLSFMEAFGIPEDKWTFDLTTVRGLDYYTGFVLETVLLDFEEVGSVFSGGRYDNLIGKLGGMQLSAVGASLGFDRLFFAWQKMNQEMLREFKRQTKIIVICPEEKNLLKAIEIVTSLRKEGIPADIYLGKEKSLKSQLAYALKNNYEMAVIVAEKELKEEKVIVKIFVSYKQEEVKIEKLGGWIKSAKIL